MVRFDGAEVGKVYRLKPNEINLGSASREWFDAEIMVLGKGSGYIKVRYKLLTGRSDITDFSFPHESWRLEEIKEDWDV